jgi:hypothetical protein
VENSGLFASDVFSIFLLVVAALAGGVVAMETLHQIYRRVMRLRRG